MGKIKYLDGLKGLGALMVYFSHYNGMMFPAPDCFRCSYFSTLFMSGGFAVAVFIIISGFTAWLSVERKMADMQLVGKMLVKRYFRFAVPFGIVFSLMYGAWYVGVFSWHTQAGLLSGSEILKTAFWEVNIVGFTKSVLLSPINPDFWDAPLWMMKYVFLGTYIAVLLRIVISPMRYIWKIITISVALVLFSVADIFFIGIIIGILLAFLYKPLNASTLTKIGGITLFVFLIARYNIPLDLSVEAKNFFTATLFLLAIYLSPFMQRIFETRPMQYLGKISFSIFFIHWPILGSLTSFLFVKTQHLPFSARFCVVFFITTFAVILFSHLSEKIIERFLSDKIINVIDKTLFTSKTNKFL